MDWIEERQSWNADGKWSNVCYFNFNDSKLKFNANDADNANDNCGTAVAFPGASWQATKPTAEHLSCFLKVAFEQDVLLVVNSFYFVGKTNK